MGTEPLSRGTAGTAVIVTSQREVSTTLRRVLHAGEQAGHPICDARGSNFATEKRYDLSNHPQKGKLVVKPIFGKYRKDLHS